jgi:hypothetical protein
MIILWRKKSGRANNLIRGIFGGGDFFAHLVN